MQRGLLFLTSQMGWAGRDLKEYQAPASARDRESPMLAQESWGIFSDPLLIFVLMIFFCLPTQLGSGMPRERDVGWDQGSALPSPQKEQTNSSP